MDCRDSRRGGTSACASSRSLRTRSESTWTCRGTASARHTDTGSAPPFRSSYRGPAAERRELLFDFTHDRIELALGAPNDVFRAREIRRQERVQVWREGDVGRERLPFSRDVVKEEQR